MTPDFDKGYWEDHWQPGRPAGPGSLGDNPPSPYLAEQLGGLAAGRALDAGCGAGAEAIWLAERGWRVTAADISAQALARAAGRAAAAGVAELVDWVEADLSVWEPGHDVDLVMTHYAHPSIPQLEFYDRLAAWVAPAGTLLIVGHLRQHDGNGNGHGHGHDHGAGHRTGQAEEDHAHGQQPPAEASVTAADITARLDPAAWQVVTALEQSRTMTGEGGRAVQLRDVVVRATRRSAG